MRILFIIMLSMLTVVSYAQSSKKKKKKEEQNQPNSVDPATPEKEYVPKKKSESAKIVYDNAEEDFYKRMKELEKTRRKNEKMMDDPQYSDPMYFGHKRPPKKHKPGKMKFCKVCGIRH